MCHFIVKNFLCMFYLVNHCLEVQGCLTAGGRLTEGGLVEREVCEESTNHKQTVAGGG